MTPDWKECKLSELSDIKGGKRLPAKTALIQTKTAHPYIRVRDLTNKKILDLTPEFEYVDDETQKTISKYIVNEGDVIISIVGTIGLVAIIGTTLDKANLTENCAKFINLKKIDNHFLYYYLISEFGQQEIKKNSVGAVQAKLPLYGIGDIKINLPPLETQQKIAKVLSAIDNKIELNNKINENLEQQAQAIFKSWFVDFEPFGGVMPGDWKLSRLENATSQIIRGFTSKYVEKSNLINLNQKVNKGNLLEKQYYKYLREDITVPEEKYAQKGDILLNSLGQGTLGRIHYWNEETRNVVVDQHITIIREKENVSTSEFLYLLLISNKYKEYFEGCITGTTGMLMLNISAVRNTEMYLPNYNLQKKFSNIITPIYKNIEANIKENENLIQLRDTLLPKLMSGEIDAEKVEI